MVWQAKEKPCVAGQCGPVTPTNLRPAALALTRSRCGLYHDPGAGWLTMQPRTQ